MQDLPANPNTQDFREAAERSQAANIADGSAGYVNAAGEQLHTGDYSASAQEAAAQAGNTATPVQADNAPDTSDSIEPFHIPGSAEDIHVAGETGPGPSG